jgi:anti-sigma regulatory factor (Ser/Thr protein kinase)
MKPLTVPGTLDSLSKIGQYVNTAAQAADLDKKVSYHLRMAVDEIATNIIVHGYDEAGLTGDVLVLSEMDDQTLTITLEDTSAPFDPRKLGRPDQLDLPVEERPIGGLGIYLTIQNVDKFDYEYVDHHNRNIFIINRSPRGAASPR